MHYRVVITDPADRNFREHFQWIRERSPQGAEAWRARIIYQTKDNEVRVLAIRRPSRDVMDPSGESETAP